MHTQVLEIMERDSLVATVASTTGPAFQVCRAPPTCTRTAASPLHLPCTSPVPHLQARLSALGRHPLVGETRGAGLLGGLELVADKPGRAQWPPAAAAAAKVVAAALEHGLILRPLTGDVVAICPPLVVSLDEIDEIFDKLEAALDDAADGLLRLA